MEMNKVRHKRNSDNLNLSSEVFLDDSMSLNERAKLFSSALKSYKDIGKANYHRLILSPADREVLVQDEYNNEVRKMIMFGSNNYLGLANHPYIKEKVIESVRVNGSGIGGSPFLNGYTKLAKTLEERLAHIKNQESAVLFSSGYSANLGLVYGLMKNSDYLVYDDYSHASFYDGIRLARPRSKRFSHNSVSELEKMVNELKDIQYRDLFVAVEGLYSMDGDTAPLPEISAICKNNGALLVLDDAHGTGVLGDNGHGTGEYYGMASDIDIAIGTFSKAMSVNGGFIAASKDIIEFLRWYSRSYMFSAAMPPPTLAAAHAALDIIEQEPHRREQLRNNIDYLSVQLNGLKWEFNIQAESPIIIVKVPSEMDIQKANMIFHENNVFVNAIEYPAVDHDNQRFRISLMATHTKDDLDRLVELIDKIWSLWSAGNRDVCFD